MALPEFDAEEEYLLHYIKHNKQIGRVDRFAFGTLTIVLIFSCLGFARGDRLMMLIAAFALIGCRIYEEIIQFRWTLVFERIIEKYETALERSEVGGEE